MAAHGLSLVSVRGGHSVVTGHMLLVAVVERRL